MSGVRRWLEGLGLDQYAAIFAENDIDDLEVLPELSEQDLEKLGVSLGHRKKLLKAIAALSAGGGPEARSAALPNLPVTEAERRQLTVLFCDLVGSTEISARLDPEDFREVIRAYRDCCAEVISHLDGSIANYAGDGVLIYFGYPRAHEDDPERAVRAGLGIVEAVGKLRPHADLALQARVGIATGPAVVGHLVGAWTTEEQTVVGETPNLAARLQVLAEPSTVIIAPSTRRLVGDLFDLEALGPLTLKGFAGPVRAWRVVGEGSAEGRFEALHGTRLTPLVGRERELALLLDRWEQVKGCEGQVVLLSGEAGIGKSRIVWALRERLAREPHTRLSYHCSPYHQGSALYPVIAQLERAAGFERGEPPEWKLDKLEALLAQATENVREITPLLAELLAIPAGDRYPPLSMSPQRQKEKTLEALTVQLAGLAARQPLLLVFEDLHWVDPTSLELLGLVVDRVPTLPALALFTFRPEFAPPWGGRGHVTTLTLNHLSRKRAATMVTKLSDRKVLPTEVRDQIVQKADGVPLFVEELTKAVLESGLLKDEGDRYVLSDLPPALAIPATLQDSLVARLDRLAPAREVAQIGAAIGREFSHELLGAVAPTDEATLQEALRQLAEAKLIFRRGVPPQATYSFKHVLVQEATYATLLRSRRQQLHARIARALEDRFPEVAETQPQLLAHHFTEAGLALEAIGYWRRAGERAAGRSAILEARAHLQKGLELVGRLPAGKERDKQELCLLTALGPVLMALEGWCVPEVECTYARARELAAAAGRSGELFPTVWGWWLLSQARGDHQTATELVKELVELARQEQNADFLLQANHAGWATLMALGDLFPARQCVEQGLALYDPEKHSHHATLYGGHDPGVCGHSHAAIILWMLGHSDQALGHSEQALSLARATAHAPSLAHALWFKAHLHELRREPREVRDAAEALLSLGPERGLALYSAMGAMFLGWALVFQGHVSDGLAQLRAGFAVWNEAGEVQSENVVRFAEACGKAGRPEEGLRVIDEALARTGDPRRDVLGAELYRLKGELLLRRAGQDQPEAETCLRHALQLAHVQGAMSLELRAAISLGRLWLEQGRRREALDLLVRVYARFIEESETPDLKEAEALLRQLQ